MESELAPKSLSDYTEQEKLLLIGNGGSMLLGIINIIALMSLVVVTICCFCLSYFLYTEYVIRHNGKSNPQKDLLNPTDPIGPNGLSPADENELKNIIKAHKEAVCLQLFGFVNCQHGCYMPENACEVCIEFLRFKALEAQRAKAGLPPITKH